jgi:hypothetical protein
MFIANSTSASLKGATVASDDISPEGTSPVGAELELGLELELELEQPASIRLARSAPERSAIVRRVIIILS